MFRCSVALALVGFAVCASAQQPDSQPMPRDYRGVSTRVDGIWVTPVPNAPFSAEVQIVSKQKTNDGGERILTTKDHIARSSSGVIHNELHRLVPPGYPGEPPLRSVHIYDPATRLNIFLDPMTRLAREATLTQPMRTPGRALAPAQQPEEPGVKATDLGVQQLKGVELRGTRKTRIVAADRSGTGKPVEVVDEYWYSPDLSVYMIIKHDDPRTGEQIVAVTDVERHEPPAEMFRVPEEYKVVDETPPQASAQRK